MAICVEKPECGEKSDWGQAQLDRLSEPRLASIIERNVEAISKHRRQGEASRTRQQRFADAVTRFAGSMAFVYIHVAWFGIWILFNTGIIPFDPGFADLTMIVSLEAIFLTVFVLVSQNRQGELADRRAELDLQITLLDEYETTRLLHLVTALAKKAGIADCADPEIEELKADVEPEQVMEKIEASNKRDRKK